MTNKQDTPHKAENHTSIQHLLGSGRKKDPIKVSYGPEREPPVQNLELDNGETRNDIEMHESVEHKHDKSLKKYVSSRPDTIEIDDDLKKEGVESTGTSHYNSLTQVKLPITDKKVMEGKDEPISSSKRWLTEFCLYLLKQAHITLKDVHGKIKRVYTP